MLAGELFDFLLTGRIENIVKVFCFNNMFDKVTRFHVDRNTRPVKNVVSRIQEFGIEFKDVCVVTFFG